MTDTPPIIVPVVLSGGSGTRLWPASRLMQPKQLLPLVDDRSLIRATIDRVVDLGATQRPIIVTNKDHASAISREMNSSGYPDAVLILEPVGRNTAPAVGVAAHEAMTDGDPLLLILPSDHTITNAEAFRNAVTQAITSANAGYLVTFGITPLRPETGYGYINVGTEIHPGIHKVAEFREKPDAQAAVSYVRSGEYLWNSGMFLIKASRYLEELQAHAPDIAEATGAAHTYAVRAGNRLHLDEGAFARCRSDSIDFAVMERTSMAAVVPTNPGWNDVGSWESLWDIADKDNDDNALLGDVIAVGTTGSYIRSSSRLVATVGLKDLIIVDTPDALLVANMDSVQGVKEVVDILRADRRQELESDGSLLCDWGRSRPIESTPGQNLLHLWIDPRVRAPFSASTHASKQWVVVKGVARITTGEISKLVPAGRSVYIAPHEEHCLENPSDEIIEIIEVSVPTSVGEDDIDNSANTNGRREHQE